MTQPAKGNRAFVAGGYDMVGRKFFERLTKSKIPAWQKSAFHCYATMNANGHRPMREGELGEVVGKRDVKEVRKDVKKAIAEGFLDPLSNERCLVAPYDVVYRGGNFKGGQCPFH